MSRKEEGTNLPVGITAQSVEIDHKRRSPRQGRWCGAEVITRALIQDRGDEVEPHTACVVPKTLCAGAQHELPVLSALMRNAPTPIWLAGTLYGLDKTLLLDAGLYSPYAHRQNLVERYFPHASHQVILLSTDSEIDRGYHDKLKALNALDRSYLLAFDSAARTSRIEPGYFWE